MKKNSPPAFLNRLFVFFFFILPLFFACGAQMSVEEAKKVTVSMGDKSLTAPPRRIDDILSVLDQGGQDNSASQSNLRARIEKRPPLGSNRATLATYFQNRGDALLQLGRYGAALEDLSLALAYSSRSGGHDPKLLQSLAYAEFVCGNFKHAIELMEQALRLRENPSTYNGLVKLYTRVGDLEAAQRVASRGISVCNRLRNKRGWGKWPVIHAANIKAMVLEAQGKFAEAEPHYRYRLQNWSSAMRQQYPISYFVAKVYLARNLTNQDRLVEAELEIRESLKILSGLDRQSEIFGNCVAALGAILLRQGRLQDARKIISAGLRVTEEANAAPDSYVMAESRMWMGEVLTAEQKYEKAMKQFDLAREVMQQNQYLFENYFARNPALMLALVRSGRIQEADQRISAVHTQNRKLLGAKHYLTAEALGFRGMVHVLQKNDQQALRDFSEALPILIETSSAGTFSFDRKMRLRIILESYLDLLAKVQGSDLEKETGINATAEAFKLADVLSGATVHGAISANTARAAVTSEDLADLVRKEQDAQKQLQVFETSLTENLAVPLEQQLPEVIQELKIQIDILTRARMVLVEEINNRFPKYAELTNPKPIRISQLQEHLRPGEVFISIYTTDDHSYVWAIPHGGKTAPQQ